MPSSKRRDFDDTWKKEELEKSLKGTKDDRQKRKEKDRDRDRDKSRKREDEDKRNRRKEDDDRRDRKHRENGDSERKDKHRSSRHRDEDGDREKRHRKEDEDREKKHRRPKEEDEGDREKRHRRHRDENDEEREKRHRRQREENDEDRERRHRDRNDDGDKKPRRREETEEERRRRKEKERDRGHRSEENGEKSRRHRDDDRHKDDRRPKRGDDDEEERRRRHEQKKKERERQKEKEREEENERQRQRQKERERESEKEQKRKQRDKVKQDKAHNNQARKFQKIETPKSRKAKQTKSPQPEIKTSKSSSDSQLTAEYLKFLEENYLMHDDFESDSEEDSELVVCGTQDSSPEMLEQSNMKEIFAESSKSGAINIPEMREKLLNETYNVISGFERYPCITPVPHNSKTSIEDKENQFSPQNEHELINQDNFGNVCTFHKERKEDDLPSNGKDSPAEPIKDNLEKIRKSLDEMEQELLNSQTKNPLDSNNNIKSPTIFTENIPFALDSNAVEVFGTNAAVEDEIILELPNGSDDDDDKSGLSPRSIVTELATARSEVMIDVMTPLTERSEDQVEDLKSDEVCSPKYSDRNYENDQQDVNNNKIEDLKSAEVCSPTYSDENDQQDVNNNVTDIITAGNNNNEMEKTFMDTNITKKHKIILVEEVSVKNENEVSVLEKTGSHDEENNDISAKEEELEIKDSCSSIGPEMIDQISEKALQNYEVIKTENTAELISMSTVTKSSKKPAENSQTKAIVSKVSQPQKQTPSKATLSTSKEKKPYVPVGGISKSRQPKAMDPRSSNKSYAKTVDHTKSQVGKTPRSDNQTRYQISKARNSAENRSNTTTLTSTAKAATKEKSTASQRGSAGNRTMTMHKKDSSNFQKKAPLSSDRSKPSSAWKPTRKDTTTDPNQAAKDRNVYSAKQMKKEVSPNKNLTSPDRNHMQAGKLAKTPSRGSGYRAVDKDIAFRKGSGRVMPVKTSPTKTSPITRQQHTSTIKATNKSPQANKQSPEKSPNKLAQHPYSKNMSAVKKFTPERKPVSGTVNRETPMMQGTFKDVYGQLDKTTDGKNKQPQIENPSETRDDFYSSDFTNMETCTSGLDVNYSSDFTSSTSVKKVSGATLTSEGGTTSTTTTGEEKPSEPEGDDDDDYNYEEDFEDYDDDFEDDDDEGDDDDRASNKDEGSGKENHSKGYYKSLDWDARNATPNEVDDVLKAMNEENERLMRDAQRMKKQPSPYDSYDDDQEEEEKTSYRSRPKTGQKTFINFVSAKQREITGKAASKTMRRFKELRELIELDVARFDLFDMPPVSEYELYMRSFGSTGTRQAYVQTNEDNIDRELQTEEIETREMWVQNTPEAVENVGGPDFEKKEDEFAQISNHESARRAMLWDRAVNATLILLEEDAAERVHGSSEDRKQSNICLSEAFQEVEIQSFNLLKDRTVICSHFSSVQTHMLLTVHKSKHNADTSKDPLSNKGIICVWNVNSPQSPQKVLVCESQPCCCCFSPSKATLAFAGMHDGSVLIWDLREPANMHKQHRDGNTDLVLRYPTYSTAGVLQYDNHQSAVIAIQPILTPTHSGGGSEVTSSSEDGLSFQLATLEQYSVINLWVVAEIGHPDPAGSESDLGLSPGGRVKLIKSSTIQLESPLRDIRLRTTMQALDMKLLPSNNSHFYIATDTGCVIHGVRYGGKAPPKAHVAEQESPVRVTSIDFSPFPEPVFLAGCEDGTLRLHHTDCEYPLITWPDATEGAGIQTVKWCRSRPSVFFVLDTESRMHIWDLLMSDAVPMKFEKIAEEKVTSIDLSNDHSATGIGLPGRKPQMVISLESGSTEIHTLSREFSALMSEELGQFKQLIQRIT